MMHLGKWYLHRFYSRSPEIRKHLPPTAIFHARTLQSFMGKYGSVYIKPDREHQGKGILKAWKTRKGYAYVLKRGVAVKCGTLAALYNKIKKKSLPQQYIVQKAIPLAQIHGRVFDLRVMMMRNLHYRWQFFGIYSKVAGPKSIVTNISSSRSYVTTFEHAMKRSLGYSAVDAEKIKKRIIRLSYHICRYADKIKYEDKIGIDFAIDKKANIWVIEVNFTHPGFKGFSRLPDKTDYRRIRWMNNIVRKRRLQRKAVK